ncbi:saccharopine dehydrogenase related protein [Limosilactobacillus mucosae]|uniref:saccharopine dehydrogenase related protein n=1 Tax=Limosilactobacillus mucosae TaxID=97478 RepID=UPI0039920679
MNRIILIGQRNDGLSEYLLSLMPDAIVEPSFHFELQSQDVLCWLPQPDDPVDQDVYDLVDLIDDSNVQPAKIVMLSIAGTADDATNEQLQKWYGKPALDLVLGHQYAIKMIDELEFPYVIVRALPIVPRETALKIIDEGQMMTGQAVGLAQAAKVLKTALTTDQYRNQSVGIED